MKFQNRQKNTQKVPKTINLVLVDAETGLLANDKTKNVIYESFKQNDNFIVDRQGMVDS